MTSNMLEQMSNGNLQENFMSMGRYLSESKWSEFCNDSEFPIENDLQRYALAVMLENTNRFIGGLDETTRTVSIGDFQKYAFPLVRAIFPELVANSLVSVQPMLGPVSLIFYLDFVYASDKGSVRRGDTAFSSITRGASNPSYSSNAIEEESVGTGDGSNVGIGGGAATTAQLSYYPVIPGTVVITDGTMVITDNGAGGLRGDGTGTINYNTGGITGATWTIAPSNGAPIASSYQYDMEANQNIPEMDLVLQSAPVVARPRKLRTKWSLEASFNLRSLHGLEAEVELTSAVGAEVRWEIDKEIINDLQRFASAGSVFWNKDLPTGIGYTEQKLSFIDALVTGSNLIHKATGRGTANWVLCGEGVANVIETLPGFVANPGLPNGMTKGVYRAGRLNGRWEIFKDPFYADNYFLMGFKGMNFLEAGYVYAPYIPLYTTPTIVLDDFIGRKGLATQYGKKAINPLFYVTGEIGTGAALKAKSGTSDSISDSSTKKAIITHGSATDLTGITSGRGVFGV